MKSTVVEPHLIDSQTIGKGKLLPQYTHKENIPVKVFYKILNSGKKELLEPNQEKRAKIENNIFDSVWFSILDDYYRSSNKKAHYASLRKIKQSEGLRNKVTTLVASLTLYNITDGKSEVALDGFKTFGLENKPIKLIEKQIARDSSKLKLLDKVRSKDGKKEHINFWRLVSQVEAARGFNMGNIDDISLARWVEIVKMIKEKNANNTKNGRRKN